MSPEDNKQLIARGNQIIGNADPEYGDVTLGGAERVLYRDQ